MPKEKGEKASQNAGKPGHSTFSRVTMSHPVLPAGDALRLLGEKAGGNFVLMSGLEERSVGEAEWQRRVYQDVVEAYAGELECEVFQCPGYFLIAPEAYSSLTELSVTPLLPVAYQELRAEISLGAKTELYIAFALISHLLDITVVCDNFIAESPCGELRLDEMPLGSLIEALLQSARIAPQAFSLEATADYIFIHSKENAQPADLLLNEGALSAEQQALLEKRIVTFALPSVNPAQRELLFDGEVMPLKDALHPLTVQAGIEIVCHRKLADIPVNPFVFTDVTLRDALNLLIRQWPLPLFGYEVQEDRILLREK
ncbi:MAG: hypothetical protein GX130_08770 [Candidatus Hydrogenedens sp.]|jgi:hypothetical protein|nr:hypothetical protein [Candidatus Hydrogenedens sp.]